MFQPTAPFTRLKVKMINKSKITAGFFRLIAPLPLQGGIEAAYKGMVFPDVHPSNMEAQSGTPYTIDVKEEVENVQKCADN